MCKVLAAIRISGAAKRRALGTITDATEKATRWLWLKRVSPWIVMMYDVERPKAPYDPSNTDDASQCILEMYLRAQRFTSRAGIAKK